MVSISTDAVVLADQTTTSPYTVRGTLGLPVQSPGGNRIGVAVIDSGVEPGPEFGDRIVAFYDFTQGIARPASDAYGHGTHVAGLIAGDGTQSQKRYRGVAPKARLIVLKVLDGNGQGRTSDVISAIDAPPRTKTGLASRSSTCRSAIQSTSPPKPIRSCRRSKPPLAPASTSSRPPAITG